MFMFYISSQWVIVDSRYTSEWCDFLNSQKSEIVVRTDTCMYVCPCNHFMLKYAICRSLRENWEEITNDGSHAIIALYFLHLYTSFWYFKLFPFLNISAALVFVCMYVLPRLTNSHNVSNFRNMLYYSA